MYIDKLKAIKYHNYQILNYDKKYTCQKDH